MGREKARRATAERDENKAVEEVKAADRAIGVFEGYAREHRDQAKKIKQLEEDMKVYKASSESKSEANVKLEAENKKLNEEVKGLKSSLRDLQKVQERVSKKMQNTMKSHGVQETEEEKEIRVKEEEINRDNVINLDGSEDGDACKDARHDRDSNAYQDIFGEDDEDDVQQEEDEKMDEEQDDRDDDDNRSETFDDYRQDS